MKKSIKHSKKLLRIIVFISFIIISLYFICHNILFNSSVDTGATSQVNYSGKDTKLLANAEATVQQGNLLAYVENLYQLDNNINQYRNTFGIGETIVIEQQFDEPLKDNSHAEIVIKFGDGSPFTVNGTVSGSKITFKYAIRENIDNGLLQVIALSGIAYDTDGTTSTPIGLPQNGIQFINSESIIADSRRINLANETVSNDEANKKITISFGFTEPVYYKDNNNIKVLQTNTTNNIELKIGGYEPRKKNQMSITYDSTTQKYTIICPYEDGDNGMPTVTVNNICDLAGNDLTSTYSPNVTITTKQLPELNVITENGSNVNNVEIWYKDASTINGTEHKYDNNVYLNKGDEIYAKCVFNENMYNASNGDTYNQSTLSDAVKSQLSLNQKNAQVQIGSGTKDMERITITDEIKNMLKTVNSIPDNETISIDMNKTAVYKYVISSNDNGELTINLPEEVCYDFVGHKSKAYTNIKDKKSDRQYTYIVDTTKPQFSEFTSISDTGVYSTGSITETIKFTEDVSTGTVKYEFSDTTSSNPQNATEINTNSTTWTNSRTYSSISANGKNGKLKFYLSNFKDKAGNIIDEAEISDDNYYADNTPPVLKIEPEDNITYTNKTKIKYIVTITDNSNSWNTSSLTRVGGVKSNTLSINDIIVTNGIISNSKVDSNNNLSEFEVLSQNDGKQRIFVSSGEVQDNAGNTTTVETICDQVFVDTNAPNISNIQINPNGWTTGDVTVTCFASDVEPEENLTYTVTGPEGSVIGDSNKSITISTNGDVTFTVTDKATNTNTRTIHIGNIDKTEPSLEVTSNPNGAESNTLTINSTDEISGIKDVSVNGTKVALQNSTYNYIATENGNYIITVEDNAGNQKTQTINVNNIDKTAPKLSISYSTKEETNQNVTVTITSNEEIQAIDGWNLSADKLTLTKEYSANTTETITVKDLGGNPSNIDVNIFNIDKNAPFITNIVKEPETWTKGNTKVTVYAEDSEGKTITYRFDNSNDFSTTNSKEYSSNGVYTVYVKDSVGNQSSQQITIDNIDRKEPTLNVSSTPNSYLSNTLSITASDDSDSANRASGINEISINGTKITLENGKYNYTATENGEYTITVTDNAGNSSTNTITIDNISDHEPQKIVVDSSLEIKTKNSKNYIILNKETNASEIYSKVKSDKYTLKIKNSEKTKNISSTEKISTGDNIVLEDLNNETQYILVIKGDIKCDSKIDISDMFKLNQCRLGTLQLEDAQLLAGDINSDETINVMDLFKMNQYRLGTINNF